MSKEYPPFTDQDKLERPVLGLIAEIDVSQPYELDAVGVFAVDPEGYLVVNVGGCSCWPDRGSTEQTFCPDKAAVDRAITGEYRPLLDDLQKREGKVQP